MPRKPPKKHDPEVLRGIARGPWAIYWDDREEERGRSFSGQDIYEAAPEAPRWAAAWAKRVADAIVSLNGGASLAELHRAAEGEGFDSGPESFGSYLGLQATGEGVRWDNSVSTDLTISVPSAEFYEGAGPDLRFASASTVQPPKLSDFGHDDLRGEVAYKGRPIAALTNRGWTPVPGAPDSVVRAVSNAIFATSNSAPAAHLRRRICEELGL